MSLTQVNQGVHGLTLLRDTVNAVGLIPKRLPFSASNAVVRTFRHAVALDERRAKFKANLWNRPTASERVLGWMTETAAQLLPSPLEALVSNGTSGEAAPQMTTSPKSSTFAQSPPATPGPGGESHTRESKGAGKRNGKSFQREQERKFSAGSALETDIEEVSFISKLLYTLSNVLS